MPPSNPGLILTRTAAGTVSANRAVTFGNAYPGADGAKILGVTAFDAASGEDVALVVTGTAPVVAGAVLAGGIAVIADTEGRAIPATGAVGENPFGDTLSTASAAGALVEVLLRR